MKGRATYLAAILPCIALCLCFLCGCASAPALPGAVVDEARLLAAAIPGVASRASLLAAFGPTTRQRFDSGVEVWLYLAPSGQGRYAELVIGFDRAGIVRQVRRRPPHPFDAQ